MKLKKLEKYQLNYSDVRNVTLFVRVFDNKVRWAILEQLEKKEYMNVTELYVALKTEQSVVSVNLAAMRKIGLVATNRHGKKVFYSINNQVVSNIKTIIEIVKLKNKV
jgi:predicted transcriptional regulator